MGFFHIKELRQHCRELRRDYYRASKELDRAVLRGNEKEERVALRWVARIERDMREIEDLRKGWPLP